MFMKNKILLSLLVSGMLSSAAVAGDIYLGVEYGMGSNETEHEVNGVSASTYDNNYDDIKLKFGAGEDGGFKGQVTLSFISFDETVFDNTNSDLIEIGFDVIKEFEVTNSFYPFLKAGVGYGFMDVEGYTEDSIYEISFNVGAGVSYKAVDNLYLVGGIDYIGRKWQDIEYYSWFGTTTVSTTDSGFKPYIGLNYKF
jgi:opacity protein-like surface antigen